MLYYWFAIADNLIGLFKFLAIFLFGFSLISLHVSGEVGGEDSGLMFKGGLWCLCISAFFGLLAVFTPNQKQLAFIVAAPTIVSNEDVQDTVKNLPKITKFGTDYIIEVLKEKQQ